MKNITLTFFIYIILLSGLLTMIDYILHSYPHLIGPLGFASACFLFIPLFQYIYIKRINKQLIVPFLKHSIIVYGVLFILILFFYSMIIYSIIPEKYIVYSFIILNLLVWCVYFYLFKKLFQR